LVTTKVIFKPSQGDLLSLLGTIGGFLGLLATVEVFLLGTRTSLISPGFTDQVFFKQRLERLFKRLMPASVETLFASKQIRKCYDGEAEYQVLRSCSTDTVENNLL
jgi:hypothetical protein